MSDDRQEIRIVGVSKEAIEMGQGKQSLWIVPFQLSLTPNQDWERRFYEVQQRDKSPMKRKGQIVGSSLKMEISEADDLQQVLDVVRVEVADTNTLCEGDYQTKLKIRRDLDDLQHKQGDVTKRLKDESDKLTF